MVDNKIPFPKVETGVSDDDRIWAMVCHLSCLFGGILLPGLVFYMKKDTSRFIAFHARQALVYQAAVFLLMVLSFGFLFPLAPLFFLVGVILSFKARNGEWASYPVIGPFLSQEPNS